MTTAISSPMESVPREGRALPAFAWIGWRWISRNPASAIAPILQPFIFLYFLSLISPPGLFPLEVLGAMMFTTQNIGSWVLGDSATWRIELAVQDLFVASPMGKVRYLFGVAFSNLIAAAPALLVLAAVLALSLPAPVPWTSWVILASCLTVVWILFSAIGVAMSSRLTSQREIWPVGNLTFTVIGMLSPLYYPLSYLPPVWQTAARFLPTTYAALLVQGAFGLTPASPVEMAEYGALLLALALGGTWIALSMYRWRSP
ncbi:MAG: ABC transporter permease [Thermoplasmata archaeon]|nr:ABC transporter permease [Thermoplasmata archaeon]MCI4355078.1 ABC transporter permease [Thermoplasmata archaeon]